MSTFDLESSVFRKLRDIRKGARSIRHGGNGCRKLVHCLSSECPVIRGRAVDVIHESIREFHGDALEHLVETDALSRVVAMLDSASSETRAKIFDILTMTMDTEFAHAVTDIPHVADIIRDASDDDSAAVVSLLASIASTHEAHCRDMNNALHGMKRYLDECIDLLAVEHSDSDDE